MATNGQASGLTVDEMKQRYSRKAVEEAMYRPYYTDSRLETIKQFEEQINNGLHVETCKEGLADILHNTPAAPPLDPTEPAELSPDVQWKIRILKFLRDDSSDVAEEEIQDWHRANIESILGAYRSRQLKLDNDMTSVWYAGHLVAGPMSRKNLDTHSIYGRYSEWNKEYGPGLIWIEKGDKPSIAPTKLNMAAIPPCNSFSHHPLSISARLVGNTVFTKINRILDDTGSAHLELFRGDDCRRLGLTPAYNHRLAPVLLDTANGLVRRAAIRVELQLEINDNALGPICTVEATISPGVGGSRWRCSGMFLRDVLFTGTSPNGQGDLYVSDRKTGIATQMPR